MKVLPLSISLLDSLFVIKLDPILERKIELISKNKPKQYNDLLLSLEEGLDRSLDILVSRDFKAFVLTIKDEYRAVAQTVRLSHAAVPINCLNPVLEEEIWVVFLKYGLKPLKRDQLVFFKTKILEELKHHSCKSIITFSKSSDSQITTLQVKEDDYTSFMLADINEIRVQVYSSKPKQLQNSLEIIPLISSPLSRNAVTIIPNLMMDRIELALISILLSNESLNATLKNVSGFKDRNFYLKNGMWPGIYVDKHLIHNFVFTPFNSEFKSWFKSLN